MDSDEPETCKVCLSNYNETVRRPCTLPCGHTICSQCTKDAVQNALLICPSCHTEHSATADAQFPVSYSMEALLRKLKGIRLTSLAPESVKPQHSSKRKGKMLRSLTEEYRRNIDNFVFGCEEALSLMSDYQRRLTYWKRYHQQLEDGLNDLLEQNKAAMKPLKKEVISVANITPEGEEGRIRLKAMVVRLDTLDTAQEIVSTIDEYDLYYKETEHWIKKCKERFPDASSVHTSIKVQEIMKQFLKMMPVERKKTIISVTLEDPHFNIPGKIQKITEDLFCKMLTVEHLRFLNEPVKKLLIAGRVFAVKELADDTYYARITFKEGRLCLHSLIKQPLPAFAATLKHGYVLDLLNRSSTVAFLNLGCNGSPIGQVDIRVNHNTGLARQFIFLCTGQQGKTYLNTNLLRLGSHFDGGKFVVGGDYEWNDGSGGHSVLFNLKGEYGKLHEVGAVSSRFWPDQEHCAQFCIGVTEGYHNESDGIFGYVERGMGVVMAAAEATYMPKVTVMDCGVVLPL
nr:uncharacterized protein LOC123745768 [Procambarus clarkii]